VTREFAQAVKHKLSAEGLYLMNVVDIFPDAKLVKSLIKTLQTEFNHVDVWLEETPEAVSRVTYVISAQNSRPLPEIIKSQRGFERLWLRVNGSLSNRGTAMQDLPILTDDYVPVERLLAGLLFSSDGL
jgi:spermidine synthase